MAARLAEGMSEVHRLRSQLQEASARDAELSFKVGACRLDSLCGGLCARIWTLSSAAWCFVWLAPPCAAMHPGVHARIARAHRLQAKQLQEQAAELSRDKAALEGDILAAHNAGQRAQHELQTTEQRLLQQQQEAGRQVRQLQQQLQQQQEGFEALAAKLSAASAAAGIDRSEVVRSSVSSMSLLVEKLRESWREATEQLREATQAKQQAEADLQVGARPLALAAPCKAAPLSAVHVESPKHCLLVAAESLMWISSCARRLRSSRWRARRRTWPSRRPATVPKWHVWRRRLRLVSRSSGRSGHRWAERALQPE